LAGFEEQIQKLDALGVKVIAASVDPEDKAQEVANDLSYPVAYGVTRADAEALDSWWEDRRSIIQPSEFVLTPDGKVMLSTYSSGPIGRMNAASVVAVIEHYESRK
jgi:peroxiredoxin